MEYSSNSQKILARIALIRAVIAAGAFSDALVAGLNASRAIMVRRIFNQSLDAEGTPLGPYFSEQYARDRRRAGRQTTRKDLEFQGTLRRSIETVTINGTRAELRITSDESAQIARWQEQQIFNLRNGHGANEETGGRVPIFELNAVEKEIGQTTTRELLRQKFNF